MRKKIKVIDQTLTIDPGWHTGWAWWTAPEFESLDCKECLSDLGVYNVSTAKYLKTTVDRINYMADQFQDLLEDKLPDMVWIEGTAIWVGSLKSMVAAKRGDIMTLSYLVGAYVQACNAHGVECDIVTAPEWKGQMTDAMVAVKVEEVTGYGLGHYPQHTLDAVGMGMGSFGLLESKVKYYRRKRND